MNHLLDVEEEEQESSYLNYPGPFLELPSSLLEDLIALLYDRRSLPKQMLHQLLLPQLEVRTLTSASVASSCCRVTPSRVGLPDISRPSS